MHKKTEFTAHSVHGQLPVLVLRLIISLMLIVFVSCSTRQPIVRPAVELPKTFSGGGREVLPDKWWLSFNDPVLNKLIGEALTGNLNFLTVWDRLAQAQAVVRREGAALFPAVDGQAGASTNLRRDGDENFGDDNFIGTSRNDLFLGFIAAYEVDLWGRIRSIRDAAALDVRAAEEELQAAAITLSAEVASTWYELVAQNGQVALLKSQLETNMNVLELVTLRFRRGQVGATDVLQQRQLVESRRGEIATAEYRVAVLQHELAILLGQQPKAQVAPVTAELIQLPPLPDTGLPATLVQQRPDIRQAYYQVLSADRLVAAAIADRFPSLSLVAQVNASEENVRSLFDNWLASLAANLLAPIFDAGAREAEVDHNRAVVSERFKDYGQVILTALGEVEDALVQERKQRELITSLEKQLELSGLAIERVRDIYMKGAVDYLRVLDVLLTHQELQRNHIDARLQLIRFRIDLCRALGGGWQMGPPELMTLDEGSETKSDNSM